MTIGQAWIDINQRAIDSDHGTDVESAFRHLRARLAAAKTLKIGVEVPVRLMVVSAEHVNGGLADRVALYTFLGLTSDVLRDSPLLQRVFQDCQKEELLCSIRRYDHGSIEAGLRPEFYELLVEPI